MFIYVRSLTIGGWHYSPTIDIPSDGKVLVKDSSEKDDDDEDIDGKPMDEDEEDLDGEPM